MDRNALLGDEPLIVFTLVCCLEVFNIEFYYLQRCCKEVASLYVIGVILLQMWQELMATLWQIR